MPYCAIGASSETDPSAASRAIMSAATPLESEAQRNTVEGVTGSLPPASAPDLVARARAAKDALGERVFVLGHHYQRDEVIQFADVTGD